MALVPLAYFATRCRMRVEEEEEVHLDSWFMRLMGRIAQRLGAS
jgi:hypothetical protein